MAMPPKMHGCLRCEHEANDASKNRFHAKTREVANEEVARRIEICQISDYRHQYKKGECAQKDKTQGSSSRQCSAQGFLTKPDSIPKQTRIQVGGRLRGSCPRMMPVPKLCVPATKPIASVGFRSDPDRHLK
jgi:hypothetical protein